MASIFIDLYDELRRTGQLVEEPDLAEVNVGDIISVRMGPAIAPLRRIVDQLIRLLNIMAPVLTQEEETRSAQVVSRQQRRAAARDRAKQGGDSDDDGATEFEQLRRLVVALRDDLDQSGMIDIAVETKHGTSVVLMLDKRFVEPPALELIHTSSFTVVGRVTNIWRDPDAVVNLYRRSVLSLLPALTQSMVWAMFAFLGSIASGLDVNAMERAARLSITGKESSDLDDESGLVDASAEVRDDSSDDIGRSGDGESAATRVSAALESTDGTAEDGSDAAAESTDEVMLGEDIAALTPVVEAPAIQVLPLAICS